MNNENKIAELKHQIKNIQAEIEVLKRESEIEFEPNGFYLKINNTDLEVNEVRNTGDIYDVKCIVVHNAFKLSERKIAEETAEKIKFLLKLTYYKRLYDAEYVPDWKNMNECKYGVYYAYGTKKYKVMTYTTMEYGINAYFSTFEIAQKVCDILNTENICY